VHIIGGEKGDAFIAFSTDEDARQGMMLTGERVNDAPVRLFLSSKTEMQNVIAAARSGPINVPKPKEDSFDRLPSQMVVNRNDDFRGPGYPEGRVSGFPEMSGSRNPGSHVTGPQSLMFGGNANGGNKNFHREAGFNQSGSFNDQHGLNQGAFNPMSQNQMSSNRGGLNSMGPLNQSGFNKPPGSGLYEANQHGEGNQQGFNRPSMRLAEDGKPLLSGRLPGPPSQGLPVRSLFDTPLLDSGSRNGNMRLMDKPLGEMHEGQLPSDQSIGGSWRNTPEQRDVGRMAGGFGGNNVLGMERDLSGQDLNRPDKKMRNTPFNFEPSNRFSQGENNFGSTERFNNGMDVDIDRPKLSDRNDFAQANEMNFNRPNNQDFNGASGKLNERSDRNDFGPKGGDFGPNGGDFGRAGERDFNIDRRDSFRDREPFGFGRNQLGIGDQDAFGRNNSGIGRINPMMPGQRLVTGLASDFGQVEGFGDRDEFRDRPGDLGPNRPGLFRNERPFGGQEPSGPFGEQEPGRPFDEQDPVRPFGGREGGRSFGGPEPERSFGVHGPPARSFGGHDLERNPLWSDEPMEDFDNGRPGRLEAPGRMEGRNIPSILPPRDQLDRPAFGSGGNRRDSHADLCVHLYNIPLTFNYREVRRMFINSEIPKEGLKLINDKFGERSGESFIKFDHEKSFLSALVFNNRVVDGNKMRVESCTLQEFKEAVDNFHPPRGGGLAKNNIRRSRSPLNRNALPAKSLDLCVMIKNIPLKTTPGDVKKFLGSSLQITATGGPFLDLSKENQLYAAVEFVKEKDFREALLLNRRFLGGSMVSVIDISKMEFNEISQAAKRDAEIKIANASKESASEKDKKDVVTKTKDSVVKPSDTKSKESTSKPSHGSQRSDSAEENCLHLAGLNYMTSNADITEFFKGMKIVKDGIYIVLTRDGKSSGTAYVEFASAADKKRGLSRNKQYLCKRYIQITPIPHKQMVERIKAAKERRATDTDDVIVLSEEESSSKSKVEHTVRMQNLHSDSQLEDIMDFFRGLHPIVDSIKLQYKDGKPTGDGLVSFQSAREADKAISEFNRRSMLGRPVTLTVWPKK